MAILFAVLVVAIGAIWYGFAQEQPSVVVQQPIQTSTITQAQDINQTTSSMSLPLGYVNVQYYNELQVADPNISIGDGQLASTSGQLPPGLSVQTVYPPCPPPMPGTGSDGNCPNDFVISGTPTRTGAYTFSIIFSLAGSRITQPYQIKVLPQDQAPVTPPIQTATPPPTPPPSSQ